MSAGHIQTPNKMAQSSDAAITDDRQTIYTRRLASYSVQTDAQLI
ncbi:hypothetical protein L581_3050 [Serratia fonticola AU-AP2C]|nr:hypothetical protein L581_3050 [Serratia fonticola AU-AP2C]